MFRIRLGRPKPQFDSVWARVFVVALLGFTFVNFVVIPLASRGPTYDRPLDWQMGSMVRDEASLQFAEAVGWTVRLKPDDPRRRSNRKLKSPGTAVFFADDANGAFVEKLRCRYLPEWGNRLAGPWPLRPVSVAVTECVVR